MWPSVRKKDGIREVVPSQLFEFPYKESLIVDSSTRKFATEFGGFWGEAFVVTREGTRWRIWPAGANMESSRRNGTVGVN